jgi:Trypsin
MKSTSKLPVIVVAVLALALATVGIASAITNGQPDGDNHPYVGLLVFDAAPGVPGWRCSGALIAPNVVLTAGHCTDGAVAARVWFDEDVTYDNVPFPLYPYGGAGSGAIEGTAYTNPKYRSPENPYGGGNGLPAFSYRDTGVVVLDEPVDMAEYAQLPAAGLVDTLKNKTAIDFVGYGVQYEAQIPGNQLPQPPPYYRWTGPRVRMYAPSELVSGKFVHSAEYMRLALNPGGGSGGTCFGDSGGPDLLGGTNTVLAVNSYVTNVNCSGVGYSARVDIPEVLDWIYRFLP